MAAARRAQEPDEPASSIGTEPLPSASVALPATRTTVAVPFIAESYGRREDQRRVAVDGSERADRNPERGVQAEVSFIHVWRPADCYISEV